jgi:two-component system response regulator AtoC
MRDKILLIDDEPNLRLILAAMLERESYQVFAFESFEEAKPTLNQEDIDVVITDLAMPKISGIEVLKYCQSYSPDLPVILITAFGTVESAVTALKNGAFDFVLKPFDQEELFRTIKKAIESRRRRKREPALDMMTAVGVGPVPFPLFGESPDTQRLRELVARASKSNGSILMSGEVGTGKRSIAYEIHRKSERSRGPFIQMQVDAIPEVFQRSELFGVEKGALPMAMFTKPGAMELAQGGTLFIEEVDSLGVEAQNALFAAMTDEYFTRLGGVKRFPLDFRLIVTTSKDHDTLVRSGQFHVELDYKVSSEVIHLKPLRERREDIAASLAPYLIDRSCSKRGSPILELSQNAAQWLTSQDWPGNLGQLERHLDHSVDLALSEGSERLELQHLTRS